MRLALKRPLRDEEHATHIKTSLKPTDVKFVSQTLFDNVVLFVWTTSDIPVVSSNVITHRLSVYKEARPIAQKKRKMGEKKRNVARKEDDKLVKVGFIKKAHYTTWLANVVMVKKLNGKWRICIDYTDLNKTCMKDSYPLPSIDCLVDGAFGHHILSFLDAYYEVMSFGLKHVGATYQRLIDYIFKGMLGRNVDIVVKYDSCLQHIQDLKEVFKALQNHGMQLNPKKCVLGVEGRNF